MAPNGFGISPPSTFRARFTLLIFTMRVSICGSWPVGCTPMMRGKQKGWMKLHQKRLLDQGKIERLGGALRALKSRNPEVAQA